MPTINFLLLYDLEVRDKPLIDSIALKLNKLGFTSKVAKLNDEKLAYKESNFEVVIINKPHFFDFSRIYQKLRGTKYVVLDTEGAIPTETYQHVLIEPEVYLHWFSHQAERYNFKRTKTFIIGYPRAFRLVRPKVIDNNLITIAPNFSALGYSDSEMKNKIRDRALKLINDYNFFEYRSFQQECYDTMVKLIHTNRQYKFVIKPHPNDSVSLWQSFKQLNLQNVEIFDHKKCIEELFNLGPKMHICFDACTTILDSYLSGIKVVCLNNFKPAKGSVLKHLAFSRFDSESHLDIDKIEEINLEPNQRAKQFLDELSLISPDIIVDGIIFALENKPVFKIYDFPRFIHLRYLLGKIYRSIFKKHNLVSNKREKIQSKDTNAY